MTDTTETYKLGSSTPYSTTPSGLAECSIAGTQIKNYFVAAHLKAYPAHYTEICNAVEICPATNNILQQYIDPNLNTANIPVNDYIDSNGKLIKGFEPMLQQIIGLQKINCNSTVWVWAVTYKERVKCTRDSDIYGPRYYGILPLGSYPRWNDLLVSGKITPDEVKILVAMSENEGNLDAVQSYDSETLTAGAMQKTINSKGTGELPPQMYKFKLKYSDLFKTFFINRGWDVSPDGKIAYYNGMTGDDLKTLIRKNANATNFGKTITSDPVAYFAEAISLNEYQDLQVEDFIERLHIALKIKLSSYSFLVSDYIKSNLGKALVLDHHVNRPTQVEEFFSKALDNFFGKNPGISKNPNEWATNQPSYENSIIEYYGYNRSGTDTINRYLKLKAKLT